MSELMAAAMVSSAYSGDPDSRGTKGLTPCSHLNDLEIGDALCSRFEAMTIINSLRIELAANKAQKPVGYATKSELAPLLDPTQPDGSYIRIGLDHPTCWVEDTPYDHLTPLYLHGGGDQHLGEVERLRAIYAEDTRRLSSLNVMVCELAAERDRLREQVAELLSSKTG